MFQKGPPCFHKEHNPWTYYKGSDVIDILRYVRKRKIKDHFNSVCCSTGQTNPDFSEINEKITLYAHFQ